VTPPEDPGPPRRRGRYTPGQAARIAITARLRRADWRQMTAAARSSPRNPASLDRWREQARAENPALDAEQADRLAEMLRSAHYRELGKRSGQARAARNSQSQKEAREPE
jgi:hypothetical protein